MAVLVNPYRFGTPAGTTLISDSFNRADSAVSLGSADVGGAWTAEAGTWGIASNRGYKATVNQQGYASIDTGVSDNIDLECTFPVAGTAGGGILIRSNGLNADGWFVEACASPAVFYFHQTATLNGLYNLPANYGAGDTLKVQVRGNVYTFLKNGAANGSYTDASNFFLTNTRHGLRDYGGTARFENFTVVTA